MPPALARVVRLIGLTAVVLWIANALWPRGAAPTVVRGDELAAALPRITSGAPAVSVRLEHAPAARERDWLAALSDAGVPVSWSGEVASLGLETYPAADPAGGAFVLVSAPPRTSVADALGPIDTIETRGAPVVLRVGEARGSVTLASGRELARTEVAPASPPRRVVVIGEASWEGKFVVAALEEGGWSVDAQLRVRPGQHVGQPGSVILDTARHAVVIVLDSAAVRRINWLDRFVRAGGGLILSGEASRASGTVMLAPWRTAPRERAPLGVLPGDTLWRGGARVPFTDVDSLRAIVLERRGGRPVIVARRHHNGRVLAVGYDETWRWRMAGGANSVAEHRAWWSRLVASVALSPSPAPSVATGAAPLAALHASLGNPDTATSGHVPLPRALIGHLFGALALAALLAEWFLRRFKGQP